MTDSITKVVLSRGIFLSFLWGMGLKKEILECTESDVTYEGIAKRFGIWRWTRINTTAKLSDVRGLHDMSSTYPILWILTLISAMNALANLAKLDWWWSLQIWKLPYLWVGPSILGAFSLKWLYVHCTAILIWGLMALVIRKRILLIDAGPISSIKYNTRSLSASNIEQFIKSFYTIWSNSKPTPRQ